MLHDIECSKCDVIICLGSIPKHIPTISDSGVFYEASPNDFHYKLDHFDVAFRVQSGNLITIDTKKGAFKKEHELFLLSSVMGALLHQRNMLPIHGSAVSTKKGTFVFAGKSSSGKSTLATEFLTNGYQIIADDISAISYSNNNEMIVNYGVPYLKLWQDVLEHYNLNQGLKRIRPEINKYFLPCKRKGGILSQSIAAIVILSAHNSPEFKIKKITGINSIEYLRQNTFRYKFIKGLDKVETHFNLISKIASQNDVFLVERPKSPMLIKELREFIELELFNLYELT